MQPACRRRARKTLALTAVLLAVATTGYAQSVAAIEQAIDVQVVAGKFMGSVLIARGEDVVFSKAYGEANLEWGIANTPSTKFRLGSITKQFTAVSILLLEERGKLKTTDAVKAHLTDAPASWDGITLHHLLTHASGIPNFTASPDYRPSMTAETTTEKTIASSGTSRSILCPGQRCPTAIRGTSCLARSSRRSAARATRRSSRRTSSSRWG